jgi:hypothetical protein
VVRSWFRVNVYVGLFKLLTYWLRHLRLEIGLVKLKWRKRVDVNSADIEIVGSATVVIEEDDEDVEEVEEVGAVIVVIVVNKVVDEVEDEAKMR